MTSTRRPSATWRVRSACGSVARALSTPMSTSLPIPRPSCHLRRGGPLLLAEEWFPRKEE